MESAGDVESHELDRTCQFRREKQYVRAITQGNDNLRTSHSRYIRKRTTGVKSVPTLRIESASFVDEFTGQLNECLGLNSECVVTQISVRNRIKRAPRETVLLSLTLDRR
jgi:hypothetical protein